VEYKRRHEKSLLKDFRGYWDPIIALIVGAIITGFIWEYLNRLRPVWGYINLPFIDIRIAGVPVVILLGWVLLFIVYLSFYRAVSQTVN